GVEFRRRPDPGAVPPGHPLALEAAPGERRVADRPAVPEVLVGSVRARKPGEQVALHHARRPATLAHAGDVDALARLEDVADLDLAPDRRRLAPGERELPQDRERARARLPELAGEGLRQPLRLGRPEPHLRRGVAVALGSPGGDDRARAGLDHGDRHEHALRAVDLRHAELPSDEALDYHWSLISTSTPAARSSLPSASLVCWVGSRIAGSRWGLGLLSCWGDFLGGGGGRFAGKRSVGVGGGIGPAPRPPVRRTVSTISRTDWSRSRWSYAFKRMRILSFTAPYSTIFV